jgi:hypothetical protein
MSTRYSDLEPDDEVFFAVVDTVHSGCWPLWILATYPESFGSNTPVKVPVAVSFMDKWPPVSSAGAQITT